MVDAGVQGGLLVSSAISEKDGGQLDLFGKTPHGLGDWGFYIPPQGRKGVPSSACREFLLGLATGLDERGYPEILINPSTLS